MKFYVTLPRWTSYKHVKREGQLYLAVSKVTSPLGFWGPSVLKESGNVQQISEVVQIGQAEREILQKNPYPIIVCDAGDAVSVNFSARCKIFQCVHSL